MELDGLCANTSQLGETAQEVVNYITSHVRSHATSLKVQTSKGNYLTSLNVRTEQVEFSDKESWDRCMDDLILKAAIWQDDHWIDRSALLKAGAAVRDTSNAVKVVLLSLDRNRELFFSRFRLRLASWCCHFFSAAQGPLTAACCSRREGLGSYSRLWDVIRSPLTSI